MPSGYDQKVLYKAQVTGVGTNAGVTQTIAAVAGQAWSPTAIECSGDAAAVVTIESPSGTPLYTKRFAAAFSFAERFDVGDLIGAAGAAILVKISASTSNCEATLSASALKAAFTPTVAHI